MLEVLIVTIAGEPWASASSPIAVKAAKGIDEYEGAANGQLLSWTQNTKSHPNHYDVYLRSGGSTRKVNAAGSQGFGGGIDGNYLVYDQYTSRAGDNLFVFHIDSRTRTMLHDVDTPGPEYHPTISGDWILFPRGTRGKTTRVLLYNRSNHQVRQLAQITGSGKYVYSGQVNGDFAVWGRVTPNSQDVFLYRIATGTFARVAHAGWYALYDPAVLPDGTVYYQRSRNGCGLHTQIVRRDSHNVTTVLVRLPNLVDGGYMYADGPEAGSAAAYYTTVKCKDRTSLVPNSADIYKLIKV